MGDQKTKPMAMLLQDPYSKDRKGEYLQDDEGAYLYEDYPFPCEKDFLRGTGSSKFVVRDSSEWDEWDASVNWGDDATQLSYEELKKSALSRGFRSIVDDPRFRQVNALAVASHTLHTVEEELGHDIAWRNNRPLEIRAHVPELGDGYYDSFSSSLYLGSVESQNNQDERAWIALSHDIISHEVGHAIWGSFRPLLVYSEEIDTDALHESFADLIALFSKLEHDALVKRLYENLLSEGGNVFSGNFFNRLLFAGWQDLFVRGYLHGGTMTANRRYDPEKPEEAHARSSIWTGAMYAILEDMLRKTLMPDEKGVFEGSSDDFTQAVVSVAEQTRKALLRALHYVPLSGVTMPLLARLFCEADERLSPDAPTIRDTAKQIFESPTRNLWDSDIRLDLPPDINQAWVEGFEKAYKEADTVSCTRMVIEQAEALRIPLDKRPRILAPRLTRTHGEIYLYFAYELVETIYAPTYKRRPGAMRWVPTGKEEPVTVPSYYGGTVIMDEKFEKPGVLVIDPPAAETGTQETAPVLTDRRGVITGGEGYLLRGIQGYRKTPGFAGFDRPSSDREQGEMAMSSNQEPYGPKDLEPDPIVEKLVSDPSEPAEPATVLVGLLGESPRDGYRRLYFNAEFDEYAEFREEDVLWRERMGKETPLFIGLESTKLWVKQDAEVMHTRLGSALDMQASFLAGDIATGSTAAAGTTARPLGTEPAVGPPVPFISDWCPPTYGPGCGSRWCGSPPGWRAGSGRS